MYVGPSQPGAVEIYTSIEHAPGYVEAPGQTSFADRIDGWNPDTDIIVNPISPGAVRIEGELIVRP